MTGTGTLPPIEDWWPHLTIEARHAVLRAPTRVLDARVREEIGRATGRTAAEGTRLSDTDIQFVRQQGEVVD